MEGKVTKGTITKEKFLEAKKKARRKRWSKLIRILL